MFGKLGTTELLVILVIVIVIFWSEAAAEAEQNVWQDD